jgi:hypothetical protein
MPTPTYTPLANITLGSAASSLTFSSILPIYRDLVIVFTGGGSTTLDARLRLNNVTTSFYWHQGMSGNGTTASSSYSGAALGTAYLTSAAKATTSSSLQTTINIMDYSAANKHTHVISRAGNAANGVDAYVNRFIDNQVINSVTILTSTGNFAIGTTAALYGIVA